MKKDEIIEACDVKKVIDKQKIKIFGIGGLPETRSEAHSLSDNFELICSRGTGELESVKEKLKVNVFTIENNSKKAEHIISDKKVVTYINSFSSNNSIVIYLFRSSAIIEEICRENNWLLVAERSALFDRLENREFFFSLLEEINYDRDFEILDLDSFHIRSDELFKRFGEKIVIQTFHGDGGKGTFIIRENDYKEKLKKTYLKDDERVVVTSFVEGFDIAMTGCVTKENGILFGPARYQFVGVKDIVSVKDFSENSFCGNDWLIEESYRNNIQQQGAIIVEKIGVALRREGFRGIFGVDFIYNNDKNRLVPLEINPRTIGTFPIETQVEELNQCVPLVSFHFLEFLGMEYRITKELCVKECSGFKKECSHVMLANFFGENVQFKKAMRGGVYCIENEKLRFRRKGFHVSDINNSSKEFILTAGVPVPGYEYKKNNQLLRILWNRSIQVDNGRDIDSEAKDIIQIVKREIEKNKS